VTKWRGLQTQLTGKLSKESRAQKPGSLFRIGRPATPGSVSPLGFDAQPPLGNNVPVEACEVCGHTVYELEGIERYGHRWDSSKKALVEMRIPRAKGKGICVRRQDIKDAVIFRLYEVPGLIFCTEEVKDLIESRHFTNVSFLEMGLVGAKT